MSGVAPAAPSTRFAREGLIYTPRWTRNLTLRTNSTAREVLVDRNTGRASGVSFVDSVTHKTYEAKAKVVVLAASTLESARLMLLSKSPQHPNGIGNSSDHVGHNFCEHVMGPGVTGLVKSQIGKEPTLDDGRPGGFYIPRSATSRTGRTELPAVSVSGKSGRRYT